MTYLQLRVTGVKQAQSRDHTEKQEIVSSVGTLGALWFFIVYIVVCAL